MPLQFTYEANPGRIVFAPGSVESVRDEIVRLGAGRALILCTPNQRDLAERVALLLGDLGAGIFDGAVMHVPVETIAACREQADAAAADCAVAIGGGSTTGLAKALTLETGLPIIAIPTTYAGSEMTPIWGITKDRRKVTGRHRAVLPRCVIYDPELLLSLPPAITGPSGLNAIAHAVEALYAPDINPITALMAEEAIRAMAQGLPRAVVAPEDIAARAATLYGAWLGGAVLGAVGMGLHHKICHTLGGMCDLPHAEMHAIMLPYVAAFNAGAAPHALARVATALGGSEAGDAARLLHALRRETCPMQSLAALGMARADIRPAAEAAAASSYPNPRAASADEIEQLIAAAYDGGEPQL
ncbi:maleylacetate reductase [Sphingomonas fennica]|uniref:Maleylacetate reductase n=1 Tax=Edaphosphingomonas fennica TaxID=114404 RepID=A0A2T4HLW4_9SPHN|nr:maleylacetate reductase [Sphingomonas fennica]PTD16802.1 maleylacetate reductase [Sphingomonas fennica]